MALRLISAAALPDVVIYAESTEDVSFVMKLAYEHAIPVTPYSGGTSLEGHITCPYGGICIDVSRMNQILEVHERDSDAVVQAGAPWEAINEELKERGLGLFFPLDPGPGACIGGMIANGCRWVFSRYIGSCQWYERCEIRYSKGRVVLERGVYSSLNCL